MKKFLIFISFIGAICFFGCGEYNSDDIAKRQENSLLETFSKFNGFMKQDLDGEFIVKSETILVEKEPIPIGQLVVVHHHALTYTPLVIPYRQIPKGAKVKLRVLYIEMGSAHEFGMSRGIQRIIIVK